MSERKYFYDEDNEMVNLRQMIRLDSEWAHSRIKACEELQKENATLKESNKVLVEALRDAAFRGNFDNYNTDIDREIRQEYRTIANEQEIKGE